MLVYYYFKKYWGCYSIPSFDAPASEGHQMALIASLIKGSAPGKIFVSIISGQNLTKMLRTLEIQTKNNLDTL